MDSFVIKDIKFKLKKKAFKTDILTQMNKKRKTRRSRKFSIINLKRNSNIIKKNENLKKKKLNSQISFLIDSKKKKKNKFHNNNLYDIKKNKFERMIIKKKNQINILKNHLDQKSRFSNELKKNYLNIISNI